jgi:hypothetical protein
MTHPTDEELILHYYGEGGTNAETPVAAHLDDCDACRSAWTRLRQTMEMVDVAEVPEPPLEFERVMWARVQPALSAAARSPWPARTRAWWSLRALVPLAAIAALIVVAFAAGRLWPRAAAPIVPAAPALTAAELHAARERVLLTALDDHFEQTQMLLVELMNAPASDRAGFDFARLSASDLVASSRLYRQTAQMNGDTRLAAVLEELESVLVDVARSPEHVEPRDLTSLRAHIDHENLLFKVRAVTNDIKARQKSLTDAE